jgi:hypothetical protein
MLNDNEMILGIMASSNLFRRAILLQQTPRQHMHLWAGCLTVTPGRRGSRQKILKTTPCKVAGGRRNRRFEPILDTSGKSAALLHHRKIR